MGYCPCISLDPNDDMTQYDNLGMSLKITERFKNVAHAVAVNDHREGFIRSIYDSLSSAQAIDTKHVQSKLMFVLIKRTRQYRIERGFMGAHSDIGGGYSDGEI